MVCFIACGCLCIARFFFASGFSRVWCNVGLADWICVLVLDFFVGFDWCLYVCYGGWFDPL